MEIRTQQRVKVKGGFMRTEGQEVSKQPENKEMTHGPQLNAAFGEDGVSAERLSLTHGRRTEETLGSFAAESL